VLRLREEPGLDLLGDFDSLRQRDVRYPALGKSAALGFDGVGDSSNSQRKGIAVKVLERVKTPPRLGRALGWERRSRGHSQRERAPSYLRRFSRGANWKRTPRLLHFAVLAITSSVTR